MTDEEIVSGAWKIRDERWGYIWGKYGQVWTAADQKAATRDTTVKYGPRWIGQRVADCSGMIRRIFVDHGLSITHSSRTQYTNYCQHKGELKNGFRTDGVPLVPGTGVFLADKNGGMHHVGLYVGGGVCIEEKGTQWGCVESGIEHWDHWGEWRAVKYTGKVKVRQMQTVKRGSAGEYVQELQRKLNLLGFDAGKEDGICGSQTVKAITRFQQYAGLDADGICGSQTWAAINAEFDTPDIDVPPEPDADGIGEALTILDGIGAEIERLKVKLEAMHNV